MNLTELKEQLPGRVCALMLTKWDHKEEAKKLLRAFRSDYDGTFVLVRRGAGKFQNHAVARVVSSLPDLEFWDSMWNRRTLSLLARREETGRGREETVAVMLSPDSIVDAQKDAVELCSATVSNIIARLERATG
jgi:hypothetical protein